MLASIPYDYALSAVVTLLVVVDPLGLLPIFASLTGGLTASERRAVAIRAVVIAGATLAGFAVAGDWFLRQLGISPASVPHRRRVAAFRDRLRDGL